MKASWTAVLVIAAMVAVVPGMRSAVGGQADERKWYCGLVLFACVACTACRWLGESAVRSGDKLMKASRRHLLKLWVLGVCWCRLPTMSSATCCWLHQTPLHCPPHCLAPCAAAGPHDASHDRALQRVRHLHVQGE